MKNALKILIALNILAAALIKEYHSIIGWVTALIFLSDKNYKIYKD